VNFVRSVIFDLDGTLVDSLPGIAWSVEAALEECGVPWRRRDLKPLVGPPIRQILAEVSGVSQASALDRLERAFRSSYDSGGWRRTVCQKGANAILRQLQSRGISLWLATNKPAHATGRILRELALTGFFQEIVCRDSHTPSFESKAEMLVDLLGRRGLRHAECLMAGDTMEDARAAAAAGIACALVPQGYGCGLGGSLPADCRLLREWSDLLEFCEAPGEVRSADLLEYSPEFLVPGRWESEHDRS
jgi:phosphoglycolate phosphatase